MVRENDRESDRVAQSACNDSWRMKPGAHPRLFVGEPYPLSWDHHRLLLRLADPEISEDDLEGEEVVRVWRKHAAEAEQYADTLDQLIRDGWRLTSVSGLQAASQITKTLEQTLQLIQHQSALPRGTPIEICVGGHDVPMLPAGGLLVGLEPHPEIYPPRTLPALVALQPSGEQQIVKTQDAVRDALGEGLNDIAHWLAGEASLLKELNATDLPDAIRDLATDVDGDGQIPRGVAIDLGQRDMDLDAPIGTISVTPVSAAVWSAVSSKIGFPNATTLAFPLDGIARELRGRGTKIATELLPTTRE